MRFIANTVKLALRASWVVISLAVAVSNAERIFALEEENLRIREVAAGLQAHNELHRRAEARYQAERS